MLVAHDGCIYYRERLGIPVAQIEAEQRKDLDTAAAAVGRIGAGLRVTKAFARIVDGRVRFEPA